MKSNLTLSILWLLCTSVHGQEPVYYKGFFNFNYQPKDGKILLDLPRLNEEFIYVQGLSTGIGSNDIGLDRGQIGRERIVKFKRTGNKIMLVQPNYSYRAKSENEAEKKSVEEAFAMSILWGFNIEKEDQGILTIDLTPFLMQDAHDVIGRLESTKQGAYKIDPSRSAIHVERTKNFPKNTEFDVLLTFTGRPTGAYIRSVTPSPEAVTVHQHHSFIALPDPGYKPRKFDPRSGFFEVSYFDYATPISEPIKKMLTVRHRLEKKNPTATQSEAIKPIIYYMDPGCPEPIKSALMDGAKWWNEAFEAAGFINAFQVKELPADVDPMDVRYHVVQWVHRSTRGWSYGNTVTDPRTGEIIKGHVSLGSLRVRQDYLIAQGLLSPFENNDQNTKPMTDMALARLRQLAAHEIGHTLGLSHNYSSSVHDRASVMDYPHPLADVLNGKVTLTNAYDQRIGPWDKRAIVWGYTPFPAGKDEDKELNAIQQETINKGWSYITDKDSRPAGSAHPQAHLWDNGKNATDELIRILALRKTALENFGMNSIRTGEPLAWLENVLVPIYLSPRYQMEAAAKIIGGVNYTYTLKGDGQVINQMVAPDQQLKALSGILTSISPTELALSEKIIQLIPPMPPGYDRDRETFASNTGLTFDPLSAAEAMAGHAFNFLINDERFARLVEQSARNSNQFGLLNYLNTIHKHLNTVQATTGLEKEIKANNERLFIHKLLSLMSDKSLTSSVLAPCVQFMQSHETKLSGNLSMQAEYFKYLYKKYKENPSAFSAPEPVRMPDGAPIGCLSD